MGLANNLAKETLEERLRRSGMNGMLAFASAVSVAFLTALFGIVSYVYQKRTERKIELRNRRVKEYDRYLTAYRGYTSLYDFGDPPAEDSEDRVKAVKEYWLAYSALFNIASDRVLRATSAFHKLAWMDATDKDLADKKTEEKFNEDFKELYTTMILKMRHDFSEKTELDSKEIAERLPFNFSKASEPAKCERAK
jgi:hypothetical protein